MRFQVAKQDLEAALQVVIPSLGTESGITSHFVFRRTGTKKDGYGVEVVTLAKLVFSSCPLKAKVEDEGDKSAFSIEGKRLKQWLGSVADAALDFVFDSQESEVKITAPKGSQTFQCLQPDSRYTWEREMKDATLTATLPAERLAAAIDFSQNFASLDESKKPELCVCEVKDGILYSTDRKAVSLVRIEDIGESNLRVHGKAVPKFVSFLDTFDGTNVEVLEHDRSLILRRGDGATFGSSRFQAPFPGVNVDMDAEDHHVWTVDKKTLAEAIGFLTAGASWEDNRLRLAPGDEDGEIKLSMTSATGKKTELVVPCVETASQDGAPDVPKEGFALDHFRLTKVLKVWKDDTFPLGVSVMGTRGFARCCYEAEGDNYLVILAWLR
jgi:DNA polymerase III sliding clamp (beta) subunit (PCNA family)